jgi:hypothetical protein
LVVCENNCAIFVASKRQCLEIEINSFKISLDVGVFAKQRSLDPVTLDNYQVLSKKL